MDQESDEFYFEGLFILALNRPEHLSNDSLSWIRNIVHERLTTKKAFRLTKTARYIMMKIVKEVDEYVLEEALNAEAAREARTQKILDNIPMPSYHTHQPDQSPAPEASKAPQSPKDDSKQQRQKSSQAAPQLSLF